MDKQLPLLVKYDNLPRAIIHGSDYFGIFTYELAGLPRRLFSEDEKSPPLFETGIDAKRTQSWISPAVLLNNLPDGDNWLAASSRTQGMLAACFLIAEDPQRRLEARSAATLSHQVSLVQHILSEPNLRRVLIADEVGLGKTIEAGLILKRILDERRGLRALYLSPARLVKNVVDEFREKLDLNARAWVAGAMSDARLDSDQLIVASIHKAVFGNNLNTVLESGPWDVIVADECHHLSDWSEGGGSPNQSYKLVSELVKQQPADGRLILMSGTPHQGHQARFENILGLMRFDGESNMNLAGRVIYRIKDQIRDWHGKPLFPKREIRRPTVVHLGPEYERWYCAVGELYDAAFDLKSKRAAGWTKGQALQWVASSVQAGLGYLIRLAIRRLNWDMKQPELVKAMAAIRPYRGGTVNEPIETLYGRLLQQVGTYLRQQEAEAVIEDDAETDEEAPWKPNPVLLAKLLEDGVNLLNSPASYAKWDSVAKIIEAADNDKIVLFAQPVETVTSVALYLETRYGEKPALIVGNQDDKERKDQIKLFWEQNGPRFLVSSRAGGEGINLQCARRLIHLDVPWNPMELEQRIGRIHRFGSTKKIIVDTIVVSGSREEDAYRIARDKLGLIVSNLDPDQFENLFSRVMSLIAPEELESILANAPPGPINEMVISEIGRLVRKGYEQWETFDKKYIEQQRQIKTLNPGAADWGDLSQYLIEHCGAKPAPEIKKQIFYFEEEEIVTREEFIPAVFIDSQPYVCGDMGGMQPGMLNDKTIRPIGLNLPEIITRLKTSIIGNHPAGAAYLRINKRSPLTQSFSTPFGALGFLRQTIRLEHGNQSETDLKLHVFIITPGNDPLELPEQEATDLVRELIRATRQKDPAPDAFTQAFIKHEIALGENLRMPSQTEIEEGIRYAVWPILAAIIS